MAELTQSRARRATPEMTLRFELPSEVADRIMLAVAMGTVALTAAGAALGWW